MIKQFVHFVRCPCADHFFSSRKESYVGSLQYPVVTTWRFPWSLPNANCEFVSTQPSGHS
jgi:hypothetical protein